ncbi:MAG TPA: DUF1127 domain-containing protein [Stellaceae bacterium]|nr:DUF1127 domain-containing protein [Stellaceae bacterium]
MFTRILNGLVAKYQDWRRRERTLDELYALDDRSLADLGISRSEIPYIVNRIPETVAPFEPHHDTFRHAA